MNWGDIGTKAHRKDRLDSLASQLPLRRTVVGAVVAGSMTVASAEGFASPGISWTAKFGDSYLVLYLTAGEVMAIVALVFVLTAAFFALCSWSCTRMRGLGSAQPDQARLRDSSAAPAARVILRGAEGPEEQGEPTPADRSVSAERNLASDVSVGRRYATTRRTTELTGDLNRYTSKTLQQTCRDLHINIGGTKEEVVRRHDRSGHTPGERRQATSVPVGMSSSRSESIAEGLLSIDLERLAAVRLCPPARQT